MLLKLKKIEIFSDNLRKEKLINFENNDNELFSIIRNQNLFEDLEKSLSKDKYFKKKNYLKKFDFLKNYRLVINTDFTAPITKKYFSRKILKEHNGLAYTTIIKHEPIDNATAVQIFTKLGPLAFLPISEKETSVVYSFYNKKNENINKLIEKYNYKYKILNIDKINSFELKSLSLRSYYQDHILAFGDLLHKIHPLAGQGFNMTIRDIQILLEIIVSKYSLGLDLDSSVNYEFEKKLKHKNFIQDLKNEKEDLKFSDLELIFKDLKSLFEKRGFIINWKALEKQSLDETINALAMASPFSLEEKQVLLEASNLDMRKNKIAEILSTYTYDIYENTTIQ